MSRTGFWPYKYGRFLMPNSILLYKSVQGLGQNDRDSGFTRCWDLLRRECVACMQIPLLSCHILMLPCSPPLLCMWSPKNLPSTMLFQKSLLHVPETLKWNLSGFWVPACTGESVGVSLRLMWGGDFLSTIFHLHFFPVKIAVATYEFIKPSAIKVVLGTARAVVSTVSTCKYQ